MFASFLLRLERRSIAALGATFLCLRTAKNCEELRKRPSRVNRGRRPLKKRIFTEFRESADVRSVSLTDRNSADSTKEANFADREIRSLCAIRSSKVGLNGLA